MARIKAANKAKRSSTFLYPRIVANYLRAESVKGLVILRASASHASKRFGFLIKLLTASGSHDFNVNLLLLVVFLLFFSCAGVYLAARSSLFLSASFLNLIFGFHCLETFFFFVLRLGRSIDLACFISSKVFRAESFCLIAIILSILKRASLLSFRRRILIPCSLCTRFQNNAVGRSHQRMSRKPSLVLSRYLFLLRIAGFPLTFNLV